MHIIKLRAYSKGTFGYWLLSVSAGGSAGAALYPDLITWRRSGHHLYDARISFESGRRLLRFSNAVANIGRGPLEMYGTVTADGTTNAYRRVYNEDGTWSDTLVGRFVFAGHADHNHWHFDDFADYNLRAANADGSAGSVVATSQKVSFANMDSMVYDPSLPGAPGSRVYTDTRQGISVGGADVYPWNLSGQFIDITSVADGTYWLESVVDPRNRLLELYNLNNAARMKLRICGSTVTIQR